MANKKDVLLDILSDEFSSEAQKDQAQAGLAKLDAESIAVNLTAEPAAVAPAPKFTSYVPAHRIGLIISGIDYTDPKAGYPAADAAARLRCPEFDGDKYRAQQRQRSSDDCACNRARGQDSDNRRAIIEAAHPTWDRIQVSNEYAAQNESHTTFKMIDGVVKKLRYDKDWKTFEVVPTAVAPVATVTAAAPPRPEPTPPTPAYDDPYDPLAGHLAQKRENAEKAKRSAEKLAAQLILEAHRVSRERLSPSIAQDL
jgi:hypothetical protein